MRFDMIDSSELARLRRTEMQLHAYGPFLEMRRGQGHELALVWLADRAGSIGRRSLIDLQHWAA